MGPPIHLVSKLIPAHCRARRGLNEAVSLSLMRCCPHSTVDTFQV